MSKYKQQKPHAPIDPDVEIPAAIRAASARSDALHKALYNPEAAGQDDPDKGNDVVVQSEVHEAANGKPQGEPEKPQPQEIEPEKPVAPVQTEKNAAPAGGDDWEHKYKSLKPRFDQQNSTISSLTRRISEMEALVSRLNEPKTPQPTPAELTFKPIGAEERETYGDDFIEVAQRAALEKVSPEFARLSNEIRSIHEKLGSVAQTTATSQKQGIYNFLDSNLANWREVNRNPEFLAWANLSDPFSGVTRIEMLREAFDKGDGPRVLNFFRGFLKDEAATDPANRAKPEDPNKGKVPLETFAAPGRAKAPAATQQQAPGEKETITQAQVANFYRLKAQGHYRGNPEEEADLERRIFEAGRDGRIV